VAFFSYAGSLGPMTVGASSTGNCLERHAWNQYHTGHPGIDAHTHNDPPGPFTRQGDVWCAEMSDILDGLTNTIFFGEIRGKCAMPASRGWAHSSNMNGMVRTIIPLNYDTCTEDTTNPCGHWNNWNMAFGFKSLHPGGVDFVFGDGSVHFLSESIDHWTYQYLGCRDDGEAVGSL
jgi:hypothetical protein